MKNQRSYGDMSGIGFNKCKGKNMKMQEEKISHFMCYWCHGMGHLAKYCPTKKTQVEPKAKPQVQVKINHQDGDLGRKKRKTRRGGRTRHPMLIQDAKMMSKNQDEKKDYAHIKCYACEDMGHFASKCSTKLEKKIQEKLKRQGNEEQHMSKKEKARSKRVCYSCRERGHMANSRPLGNNSKPISIIDNNVLRKDGNGTSTIAIAKHHATHTKAMPKYVAPNLRGPKLVWVPFKKWMNVCRYQRHWRLDSIEFMIDHHMIESRYERSVHIQTQCHDS